MRHVHVFVGKETRRSMSCFDLFRMNGSSQIHLNAAAPRYPSFNPSIDFNTDI